MASPVESCHACHASGYSVHPQADDLLGTAEFMLRHGKSPEQVASTLARLYGAASALAAVELTVKPIEGAALICFSQPITHQQADEIKQQLAQVWPDLKPVVVGCVEGVIPADDLVRTLLAHKRSRGGTPLGLS